MGAGDGDKGRDLVLPCLFLSNLHSLEQILNTYWTKPSPLSKNSMLLWSIFLDSLDNLDNF